MTKLRDRIITLLNYIPGGDAHMIAEDLQEDSYQVQLILHRMDDDGDVIMRNGFYRLSKSAEKRARGDA